MGILVLTIIFLVIGLIYVIFSDFENSILMCLGITAFVLGIIGIFSETIFLLLKPLDYKSFKIEYETIKEISTSKDDVRDATFTNNLIEINETIKFCREFKDNKWIGIFINKKICEFDLISKE